jgi:hypothetical protein
MDKKIPYQKYVYKIRENKRYIQQMKLGTGEKDFSQALKTTRLLINANRQIVYILSKYDYENSRYAIKKTIIKSINKDFMKNILVDIYFQISGETYDYIEKKSQIQRKSHTTIDEEDFIRLANLFNNFRKNLTKMQCIFKYTKLNSKLYRNILKLGYSFPNDFDSLRSALDDLNCIYDEIFEKYNFMFYGNREVKYVKSDIKKLRI